MRNPTPRGDRRPGEAAPAGLPAGPAALSGTLPVVFMFSGQGSQYYRMGQELFDDNPVFRAALERHDAVVAEELGESVLARVFDPAKRRNEPFTETGITHPAIVMIELALAETLQAAGIEPDYLLGASLGEYAAAAVSGSLPPADCLRLLVRQARALRAGPRGGMLAVLAGPEVTDRIPALRACEIAARNYPGHFVVAGTEEDLARAESALRAADVVHQRVPVEYGYHSSLMDPALADCQEAFRGVQFAPPRIPWVSCVDGGPVDRPTVDHFTRVARRPIAFEDTITAMRERGDFLYLDLGPSGTLHNFVRNNLPSGTRSRSLPLLSPFGHDPGVLTRAQQLAAPRTPRKAHGMKIYGFPGQGSQQRGMGRGLFEKFPEQTATADRVLGYSIEELCTQDPERRLGRTEFTQPALYVVSALSYLDRVEQDPVPADYLIGHSLGEYVALFAAGVFDFETGLRLVQRRGELMAAADGGAMAAVVGADEATVTRVLADSGLDGLDLANHNAMDQFVLSGPGEQIDAACRAVEAAGARAVRLHVSAPFHSRYMRGAAEEFARFLDGFTLRPPNIPVLANVDARPYRFEALKETLAAQISSPVRWTETVRTLMGHGDFEFVELGPGRVLTKLVSRIREAAEPLPAPSAPPAPAVSRTTPAPATAERHEVTADGLGARSFRERYGLRRAYLAGSLYGGISGRQMLTSLAKAGLLGFLGTGGLTTAELDPHLRELTGELGLGSAFGVNLLYRHGAPEQESALVDLLLRHGVDLVEASGFPLITPALVRFRLKGGRIIAKVSRSDVAAEFLAPPPERLVRQLLEAGEVTDAEARTAAARPMADDLCVEADGGWLSSTADLPTLLPTVLRLRDEKALPGHRVHVGCAGGLGTPQAVAAAFLLGAEFVLTGSVNQCSVEAATSPEVKDILQEAREYDVDTAPWGEMFELGVQARYLKRGLFFPARAARLHELWRRHASLAELDEETRSQVLDRYLAGEPAPSRSLGRDPKAELAALFRGYFDRGFRLATTGDPRSRVDYLVHCGPAMGAFNQAVAGTSLQPWRARTVEAISDTLMEGAAAHIESRLRSFF
ncbi:ACP S-malonyltransferase [Streptomyces sp. S.PNR 29]|uniref:ACP S-malonyltransferase n=1 Tax=Streptomyces sp. S.PNR 29 TaxID=2973805 RepID=UPI0025B09A86|nr:ACP S-malonyltransferase [Streptomyces sp. S.PNR 29]MDN0200042.1 ACP S-malonyltransferase [Streptomyces sp. S.PNR 29]